MVALGGNAALVKWRLAFGVWRLAILDSTHATHLLTLTHIRKMDRQDIRIQARKVTQDTSCTEKNHPKNQINLLRAFFFSYF